MQAYGVSMPHYPQIIHVLISPQALIPYVSKTSFRKSQSLTTFPARNVLQHKLYRHLTSLPRSFHRLHTRRVLEQQNPHDLWPTRRLHHRTHL